MTAILSLNITGVDTTGIDQAIRQHPAWLGLVSGLKAEKLLRNRKKPFLYVLRAGEVENAYYVTHILPSGTVHHTPFVITHTAEGWMAENAGAHGPFQEASIDVALHAIMHCNKNECVPLIACQA